MEFNLLDHMREMMDALGVKTQILVEPYEDAVLFDERLRSLLYKDFDYSEIIAGLEKNLPENTVYMTMDQFETNYVLFKLPPAFYEKKAVMAIGPFLTKDFNEFIGAVMTANNIPLFQLPEIKDYYCGIPRILNFDGLTAQIIIMAKHIFGNVSFSVEQTVVRLEPSRALPEFNIDVNHSLSMAILEERYQAEDDMLEAVAQGNLKKALISLSAIQQYSVEARSADTLRSRKNYLAVLNTLLRKAVQQADVHPAHIHGVSNSFAKKIEAAINDKDLSDIIKEMFGGYCALVQKHSLKRVSKPIQKTLNYIDFNYTEQLNLTILSDAVSVTASYLSTQFKKEMNVSLVDYVNRRRVREARNLLLTTALPVSKIAEMVGFLDDNYFTRIFKKFENVSPREFRKLRSRSG